ncbi:unnamed protein product [Moneuplotes crassus]|uniref:Myotubularin phosphatase domain-containing protein n=1 Tax=Euplotes crassus TaxID=5936 RepID=A0AAD1Y4C9_EUPCR|nr:unnamed protein product [Moneuplotes crassus]
MDDERNPLEETKVDEDAETETEMSPHKLHLDKVGSIAGEDQDLPDPEEEDSDEPQEENEKLQEDIILKAEETSKPQEEKNKLEVQKDKPDENREKPSEDSKNLKKDDNLEEQEEELKNETEKLQTEKPQTENDILNEENDVPQEENDSIDTNLKDKMRRVTVSKKPDNSEVDTKFCSEEKKMEENKSESEISDNFEIVTDRVHQDIEEEQKTPFQRKTTIIEKDENGKKIITIDEGVLLIFPNGNKTISVNVKVTNFTLSITHSNTEKHEQTPEYDEESDLLDNLSPSEEFDESLVKLIENQCMMKYFEIPLGLLYSITKVNIDPWKDVLMLKTKDNRKVALKLLDDDDQVELEMILKSQAFPSKITKDVRFFKYKYEPSNYFKEEEKYSPAKIFKKILDFEWDDHQKLPDHLIAHILKDAPLDKNGWEVYNFKEEYKRQGVNQDIKQFHTIEVWKEKEENTYPAKAYIPNTISHGEAVSAFEFRSKKRFPALSYYYKKKKTSLWRCAQPLVGFFNSRNDDDEKLFKAIADSCPYNQGLLIVDARSYVMANGNRIKGGGTEKPEHYPDSEIHFAGIDNIHGVRDAYNLCFPSWQDQWYTKNFDELLDKINPSKWLDTIHHLLKVSKKVASSIYKENRNVIVHCSDGWDRTAEICGLAQTILDPYYRTLKGLQVIIEKEWVSFGYQFDKRCSNFADEKQYGNDVSPVFIQFLDCLYQLLNQYPLAFQYNKYLLKFLAVEVYTCKFGSFIFNNDWSRKKFEKDIGVKLRDTVSIWTYVNDNCQQFLNPLYEMESGILNPHYHTPYLKFWSEYFFSWHDHTGKDLEVKKPDPYNDLLSIIMDQYEKNKKEKTHTKEKDEGSTKMAGDTKKMNMDKI